MEATVLKSELAGRWYTDDPRHLEREIKAYLDSVDPAPVDDLIALILPHAGYRYSGIVAAHGIKLLEGRSYRRVIVLGPSHHVAMLDRVSIPDVSHIETPFGLVPLDRAAITALWEHDAFEAHPHAHKSEHSVQIELPLLQCALHSFELIPIICGQLTVSSAQEIARVLAPLLDDGTLLVVSTDFTHYGRGFDYVPFTDQIEENLRQLDMGAFDLICDKEPGAFQNYIRNTGATVCGASGLSILLALMSDTTDVHLLKYETSGNLTDDWSHCVSYLSAAVTGHWTHALGMKCDTEAVSMLTTEDKEQLLRLARYQIASHLRKGKRKPELKSSDAMQQHMGAFVTLHKHGRLRGCIGEIFPRRSILEAVKEHAVNAAFKDPRFPPLREDELHDINIEISVLTEPLKVDSYTDIVVGQHGIVLSRNMHSAVFLPQVATEQGWDLETTLEQLSMKAGLPANAWEEGCEYHVFEAIVFSEQG